MANHLWLCPTKNKETFYDPYKLLSFLDYNIINYHFTIETEGTISHPDFNIDGLKSSCYISAADSRGRWATDMLIYSNCTMQNRQEIIQCADKKSEDTGDNLIKYLDECNLNKCMEIRHSGRIKDIL